ncbi:Uncharacterized protein DAT39_001915 [Clarias magur]|uniref:Uncharacterized protein n=1 Tax=Clarias magur TaxID=1594786 RepID=A0A8J4XFH2_CLAMG|nr:Uncharacterized protein DAT39_001915 [Clarias magur]
MDTVTFSSLQTSCNATTGSSKSVVIPSTVHAPDDRTIVEGSVMQAALMAMFNDVCRLLQQSLKDIQ